jgi:recombinational DNA repair protein (RecF pathway)
MTTYCDNCGRETPEHSLVPSDDGMVCARCYHEQGDLEDEDEDLFEDEELYEDLDLRVWRSQNEV